MQNLEQAIKETFGTLRVVSVVKEDQYYYNVLVAATNEEVEVLTPKYMEDKELVITSYYSEELPRSIQKRRIYDKAHYFTVCNAEWFHANDVGV